MSIQDMDDLMFAIAEMTRRHKLASLPVTVHEVNKDRVRARVGLTADGQHMLTPWLCTGDQHGGALGQTLHEKDQPGHCSFTGGDLAQGVFHHAIASKAHPAPAHQPNIMNGQGMQLGKMRMAQEKEGTRNSGTSPTGDGQSGDFQNNENQNKSDDTHHTYFIAKDEDQAPAFQQVSSMAEGGGAWSGNQANAQPQKSSDAKGAFRLSDKNGITGRWGDGDKGSRFAASDKGAQIAMDKNFVVATDQHCNMTAKQGNCYISAQGQIIYNKAPKIGKGPANPMKNDNNLYGSSQGGGGGGGSSST